MGTVRRPDARVRQSLGNRSRMKRIVRYVPKWIAPRLALALLLTLVGVAGLLLVPPLFDDAKRGKERVATNPAEQPADAGRCPDNATDEAVQCEINAVRAARGLPPIRPRQSLRVAAQRHSEDMVRRHYFAHISPTGMTLAKRVR